MHCNRSWQRVRDRVASSLDKTLEKAIFGKIASSIVAKHLNWTSSHHSIYPKYSVAFVVQNLC